MRQQGVKQRVEYDDLFKLPANLKAGANYPKFEEVYNAKFEQAQATEKARLFYKYTFSADCSMSTCIRAVQ